MKTFNYSQDSANLIEFPELKALCHENNLKAVNLVPHQNDGIEICIAFDGTFKWIVEGDEVSIRNKEMSITLPWQTHQGKDAMMSKGRLAWVIIKPQEFDELGHLRLGGDRFMISKEVEDGLGKAFIRNNRIAIGKSEWFTQLFFKMAHEITSRQEGYRECVYNYLSQMMVELYRILSENNVDKMTSDERMMEAIDVINEHIREPWSTKEIESLVGMKKTALNRRFKEITGYAPMAYVMQQKIEASKDMLLKEESITQIAYELNFSSSQHFSTVFKKLSGYTPRDYRRKKI